MEDTTNLPEFLETQLCTPPLMDIQIHENDVKKLPVLCELKIDKSPGADNLHPRILKEAANQLAKPIMKIYQMSIAQGKVPVQ